MPARRFAMLFTLTLMLHGPFVAGQDRPAPLPNGVAAGDVTQTAAVLWARAGEAGPVTFVYATDAAFETVIETVQVEVENPMLPAKVEIAGLMPATTYYTRATDMTGAAAEGQFRTPAEPGVRRGLRFGVSGDWRGELAPYPAIANIPARDLDFFVAHGDTIYADIPSVDFPGRQARTVEDFRIKHNEPYSERFGLNVWADVRASTALFATIDDHEVVDNFAGGAPASSDGRFDGDDGTLINDTALYEAGLQVFHEYNPIREEFYGATGEARTAEERRLYRFRTFGSDAAIFVLDARSFRDAPLETLTTLSDGEAVQRYLRASFDPGRTMLGQAQLEDLQRDLLAAQRMGVTWKFILVPEPIQNLTPLFSEDRFEGYAAERGAILRFINDSKITNVVFIAADIHGTVVNNLTYQGAPDGPQIPTGAFEVTTGAVAFDAPFGPTVIELARSAGAIPAVLAEAYRQAAPPGKAFIMAQLLNGQLVVTGNTPVGLQDSRLAAELVRGRYTATETYGWTEFEIDARTEALRVITYGIAPYTRAELEADAARIIARAPQVVSEFVVQAR